METVASPCIGVCTLDQENRCKGCYRTIPEVSGWESFTLTEKQSIIALCEQRKVLAAVASTK